MMSVCIIAAQAVMLPIAIPGWTQGRRLGAQAPVSRRVRDPPGPRWSSDQFSNNSFWLIGVQVLDGVGAGIFGALTPLVIADIMRGTGRYNLAQGAIATGHLVGIGASLSGLATGEVVLIISATAPHFCTPSAQSPLSGRGCYSPSRCLRPPTPRQNVTSVRRALLRSDSRSSPIECPLGVDLTPVATPLGNDRSLRSPDGLSRREADMDDCALRSSASSTALVRAAAGLGARAARQG